VALDAARVAIRYRTPVIVLSDSFLQNSSEPWRLPDVSAIEGIEPHFAEPNGAAFHPYARNEDGARPWAVPGTPGLQHRIGGLEREDVTGAISYDAENHERMTDLRREKVAGIAASLPPLEVDDPTGDADLLVLGWGSTAGSIRAAIRRARDGGEKVAHAHLRWLNPMPVNTGDVVRRYRRVLIPEINEGQLALLIRARFLVDARSFTRVQGRPMWADELDDAIEEALRG
jgi:2-oxoglutarate ferredoxin oxidoreductase subunit alpha